MAPNPSRTNEASKQKSGSFSNQANQHRPANPSGLRQAHMPPSSPEDRRNNNTAGAAYDYAPGQPSASGVQPIIPDASIQSEPTNMQAEGTIDEPEPNARTKLLGEAQKYSIPKHENCGDDDCNHGALSPRPRHQRGYGSFAPSLTSTDGNGGSYTDDSYAGVGGSGDSIHGVLGDALADSLITRDGNMMSNKQYLARRDQVKHSRTMCVEFPKTFLLVLRIHTADLKLTPR